MHSSSWRQELREHSVELLGSLGSDVTGVARRLQGEGITGTPRDAQRCAVAAYLSAIVGTEPHVRTLRVGTTGVHIALVGWWRLPVVVRLPKPVRAFIDQFDDGRHPELVAHERRSQLPPRTLLS